MLKIKSSYTNNKLALLCYLFLCSLPYQLSAQKWTSRIAEINIGYPLVQEQLPEQYAYNPLFLTARFPIFYKKDNPFSVYAEPQFAYTFPPKGIKHAFEFGTNLGVQYSFLATAKQRCTAAIGVGPHYLSLETAMQHKGFLFSDNFELGYYRLISSKMGIQLKTRFRHLSNANLQKPNLGIDTFFLFVGLFWEIDY